MAFFDKFGPEKILEVYNPKSGMRGILVIDNTALGPGKGGIRFTPTVGRKEVFLLARTMTWKNALAELPFGGAKAGIIGDPKAMSRAQKDAWVADFAKALKGICPEQYVAGPDISMTEHEMEVFANAIGSRNACTGKPESMGGLPHELGSTGFGVFHATKIAAEHLGLDLKNSTFAVEGFGNVGYFAAKFMCEAGARLVCVSDSKGTLYNENGIDFKRLEEVKKTKGTVTAYGEGSVLSTKELLYQKYDILITAAIPNLVLMEDVPRINAKLIVEGSNIPATPAVEKALARRGILVVPDFIANAGGVISSYVEYINGTKEQMFKIVEEKIARNTRIVLELASQKNMLPRNAGLKIAKERVLAKQQ